MTTTKYRTPNVEDPQKGDLFYLDGSRKRVIQIESVHLEKPVMVNCRTYDEEGRDRPDSGEVDLTAIIPLTETEAETFRKTQVDTWMKNAPRRVGSRNGVCRYATQDGRVFPHDAF
jgi:hypothetical protein